MLNILIIRLVYSKKYTNYFYFNLALIIHVSCFIATVACTGVKDNIFSGGHVIVHHTDYNRKILFHQNHYFIGNHLNTSYHLQNSKVQSSKLRKNSPHPGNPRILRSLYSLALYKALEDHSLEKFQAIITKYSYLKLDLNTFVPPTWNDSITMIHLNVLHQLVSNIIQDKQVVNNDYLIKYDWDIFEYILLNHRKIKIDITAQESTQGNNILHRFAANGDFNAVNRLIDLYKSYPNAFDLTKLLYATNQNYHTPLQLAEQRQLELEEQQNKHVHSTFNINPVRMLINLLKDAEEQFPDQCPIKCPEEKPLEPAPSVVKK